MSLRKVVERKVSFVMKASVSDDQVDYLEDKLNHFIDFFISKFGEEPLKELKIEIKEINPEGRSEFEIKVHLVTDFGDFHSKKVGWALTPLFKESIEAIREQVLKNRK